ncbi:MAG: hypothetical protein ABJN42_24745 [Roseibium sp.]|uniref:hypothetical protein n=1 Tax=Roseibium sp. TaxID=1936156 RepID=UPI003296B837
MCAVKQTDSIDKTLAAIGCELKIAQKRLDFLKGYEKELLEEKRKAMTPEGSSLEEQISAAVSARDPKHLAFMTLQTVRGLAPGVKDVTDEDLRAVLKGLCEGDAPVVAEMYLLGEEVLDDDTVAEWKESGELVDPDSGEIIPNPDEVLGLAWYAVAPAPDDMEPSL